MVAEALGTAALVAVVVGSGIQADRLSGDGGVELLASSLATVFGLGVLIALLGPVSGAHFNPVVSLTVWRTGGGGRGREVAAYTGAQIAGAISGAMLANTMFGLPPAEWSSHERFAAHLWLAETVATVGLILLITGLARTGRGHLAAPAVASYIGAAYWFTSSTSFANPAVTIGRALTDTYAGIAPTSVAPFVAAQLLGGLIGVGLAAILFPPAAGARPAASDGGAIAAACSLTASSAFADQGSPRP